MALYWPLALSTTIGKHQCFDDGGDDYDDDADYFNNDQPFCLSIMRGRQCSNELNNECERMKK